MLAAAVTDFYHEPFTSNAGSSTDHLLQCVDAQVTSKMNDVLLRIYG